MSRLAIGIVLLMLVPRATVAQDRAPQKPVEHLERVLVFLAGGGAGLGIHESGHVVAGVSFGVRPRVAAIRYGPLPFFAIDHDPVSPRREFVISSAGFWMQHAGSEWILSRHPRLREEDAPFTKGLLMFNVATSAVYGAAAFGGFGPPQRDTLGMAESLGRDGTHEAVVGVIVLAPAVLDGYRYFHPDAAWARWASRATKIAGIVLVAAAGR